jgi:hypothetical protein
MRSALIGDLAQKKPRNSAGGVTRFSLLVAQHREGYRDRVDQPR